ncbi:hypothetical protein [Clostridium sp. BNL1100]|uniref:hypothetical protein n=1 Tax=Clostridium sp. BNL1100 TaxID=755731 RepID=UPI00024A7F02|nr:hypothetical protein [Clostridium sp. BNL1100]AEY65403.1 hypothetical protein Clo1100_1151 [Clostridium sp. BNL1100]
MLNDLAKEVHQNAVEHGWWKQDRSFGEIIALCHSELSEALEEYRNASDRIRKLPMYFSGGGYVAGAVTECCKKPEGIAVELADCIIRILDYFGREGINIDKLDSCHLSVMVLNNFGDLIAAYHMYLSKALEEYENSWLKGLVEQIYSYCERNEIDMDAVIQIKHMYNKTRPYKHGGKVI